jgi:hypothetical protein
MTRVGLLEVEWHSLRSQQTQLHAGNQREVTKTVQATRSDIIHIVKRLEVVITTSPARSPRHRGREYCGSCSLFMSFASSSTRLMTNSARPLLPETNCSGILLLLFRTRGDVRDGLGDLVGVAGEEGAGCEVVAHAIAKKSLNLGGLVGVLRLSLCLDLC